MQGGELLMLHVSQFLCKGYVKENGREDASASVSLALLFCVVLATKKF
jgi:hypothetical protein